MNGTQSLMKAKKAKKFIKELQIFNKQVKRYFVYNKNSITRYHISYNFVKQIFNVISRKMPLSIIGPHALLQTF